MAVILIDEPDDRLDIETLTRFSFPVAFAIDPSRPDAAERAAIYREAGFEVLMLASVIPEGATASDTEVALSAARARVPEAIALMDTPDSRVQSDRAVLEAAVGAAAGEGQGFVAFPRGLNTAEQMAERAPFPRRRCSDFSTTRTSARRSSRGSWDAPSSPRSRRARSSSRAARGPTR
jgi:hypothetical protein